MAAINFDKAAEKAIKKIPSQYFMDCDTMAELIRIAKAGAVFDALHKAYCAGIVAGNHATLTHGIKRL